MEDVPGILDGEPGAAVAVAVAAWEGPAGAKPGSDTNAGLAFSPANDVGPFPGAVPFLIYSDCHNAALVIGQCHPLVSWLSTSGKSPTHPALHSLSQRLLSCMVATVT